MAVNYCIPNIRQYNYYADTVVLIEMDVGDSAAIAARTFGFETLKRSPKECYSVLKFVNGNDVFCTSHRLWEELTFCLSTSGF